MRTSSEHWFKKIMFRFSAYVALALIESCLIFASAPHIGEEWYRARKHIATSHITISPSVFIRMVTWIYILLVLACHQIDNNNNSTNKQYRLILCIPKNPNLLVNLMLSDVTKLLNSLSFHSSFLYSPPFLVYLPKFLFMPNQPKIWSYKFHA